MMVLSERESFRQFIVYAGIGALNNVVFYSIYLVVTCFSGLAPKLTITALYCVAGLIGYLANRQFTFRHNGQIGVTAVRYLLANFAGYLLNLGLLLLFVDWLDFPHQIVQAIAMVLVGICLFFLSRVFVFPSSLARETPG